MTPHCVGALLDEGQRMHRCVATRAWAGVSGVGYFFSAAYGGQKLTVEVRRRGDRWFVYELRRAANAAPSRAETTAVARWLERATSGMPDTRGVVEAALARAAAHQAPRW